jgi:uncharacterized protein GlcG (DUF336 family)
MITVKSLSLSDANLVIQAGVARANKIGSPSTIAVVDVGGTIVAQARMDGASLSSVALAYNKGILQSWAPTRCCTGTTSSAPFVMWDRAELRFSFGMDWR